VVVKGVVKLLCKLESYCSVYCDHNHTCAYGRLFTVSDTRTLLRQGTSPGYNRHGCSPFKV